MSSPMDQVYMVPNPVQRDMVSREIRLIKRRRLEIRSARAALNMEEFDLDDRLILLERSVERSASDVGVDLSMDVGVGRSRLVSATSGDEVCVPSIGQVEETVEHENADADGNTDRNEDGGENHIVSQWMRPDRSEVKRKGPQQTRNNVGLEIIEIKEEDENKIANICTSRLHRYETGDCAPTAEVITIDDDDQSSNQDMEENIVSFNHPRKRKRKRKMPIQQTSTPVLILTSNITSTLGRSPVMSSEQSDRRPGMKNQNHPATVKPALMDKLTKIVVLKVHWDPEKCQQTSAALRRESMIAANKEMLNNASTPYTLPTLVRRRSASLLPRLRREDKDARSSGFHKRLRQTTLEQTASNATSQRSTSPFEMDEIPQTKNESRPPLIVNNGLCFLSRSTSPSTCPCQGRDRNCRTCTGTPAVIAENRVIQSPSSSHQSQTHRTRMTYRPETYHIPDFEEMTPESRTDLETRFCQRIVETFKRLIHQTKRGGFCEDNTWMRNLVNHEETSATLISKLANLVDKRAVARVDDQGNWTGRRLISRCADMTEFETEVRKIVGNMTEVHPWNCCDGIDGKNNMQQCWGNTFLSYLEDMLERCRECMEACSGCINDEERKTCVADWSLI